ncbi:hypothetical protein [Propylenella binzhouense]|uniref:DNA-binding protein n=1 Tax=Propylenella binzhouense TaxID=2555902 RepID=A0A964WTI7_9HYPH|nr:hypothetical protein [Propylenella binzhouense]MYZ48033.1 hypothetical protein [Propylenella binzhouense]
MSEFAARLVPTPISADDPMADMAARFGRASFQRAGEVLEQSLEIVRAAETNADWPEPGDEMETDLGRVADSLRFMALDAPRIAFDPQRLVIYAVCGAAFAPLRDPPSPAREELYARLATGIGRILDGLDDADLARLAGYPIETLLAHLARAARSGHDQAVQEEESWRRTLRKREDLAKGITLLSAGEAAERLQISRQALDQKRRKRQVLGVRRARNWLYPELQFDENTPIGGLDEVLSSLPYEDGWALLQWLLRSRDALGGRSAFAALRDGDIEQVVAEAREVGEQGAR